MKFAPWSDKDDEVLHNLWLAGVPDENIGLMVGRTWQAVKARRLEKRWIARLNQGERQEEFSDLEPISTHEHKVFRASVAWATQQLIKRIAEVHPQYKFMARLPA